MLKQTNGTSASLPQKSAAGYNPEQPFLPVFCNEGIPGAGGCRKPKLIYVLSFMHREAVLEKGWILHPAAAQQLQVLAEAFSSLNHHKIPGQRGRQAVLHLQQPYCTDVKCNSESPILNSHSFCSWTFCSTLREALGCLDAYLSRQGLLE